MDTNNNEPKDNVGSAIGDEQPQGSVAPQDRERKLSISKRKLLIGLGLFLGAPMLVFVVYLGLNFKDFYYEINYDNSILPTASTKDEEAETVKTYKLEEIFTPEERINSYLIAPNNIYAFVETKKSVPISNFFEESEDGPMVIVMDNLIFTNLNTKEKKEFDLYELASKEIIDPLKGIPVQIQFTLYVNLLKWSAESNDFWGAISLVPGADPPLNEAVSIFKINTKDWSIEKFALSGGFINWLRPGNLNIENKSVLFEAVTRNNELFLYLYDFQTKKKTVIVSYPNNIFSKYLPGEYGFLNYFGSWLLETEEPRQLNAKWLDEETVSYIDFVTREEVIKKVK